MNLAKKEAYNDNLDGVHGNRETLNILQKRS